eukprot:2284066-Amphidinium_carterae.2
MVLTFLLRPEEGLHIGPGHSGYTYRRGHWHKLGADEPDQAQAVECEQLVRKRTLAVRKFK